jgi:hypothetical protein
VKVTFLGRCSRIVVSDRQNRTRQCLGVQDTNLRRAGFDSAVETGPGQYGDGDLFIGVRVPVIRKVAKEFKSLPLTEVVRLLRPSDGEISRLNPRAAFQQAGYLEPA